MKHKIEIAPYSIRLYLLHNGCTSNLTSLAFCSSRQVTPIIAFLHDNPQMPYLLVHAESAVGRETVSAVSMQDTNFFDHGNGSFLRYIFLGLPCFRNSIEKVRKKSDWIGSSSYSPRNERHHFRSSSKSMANNSPTQLPIRIWTIFHLHSECQKQCFYVRCFWPSRLYGQGVRGVKGLGRSMLLGCSPTLARWKNASSFSQRITFSNRERQRNLNGILKRLPQPKPGQM